MSDNARFAHSLMALRASLKLSALGTRVRISSVTLQPFKLLTHLNKYSYFDTFSGQGI